VAGTDRILPKGRNLPRPGSTTITIGAPLRPAEGEDARRMGVRIEDAVAALADEHATDWWQARRRAHARQTPSLSGPDLVSWRRAWALSAKQRGRQAPRRSWPEL
jgi:1-acyl-sn-glycerol-3-phosphate acyltransferase